MNSSTRILLSYFDAFVSAASSASASDLEALGKKADTLGKHLDKLSAILQAIELRLRGEGVDVDGMTLPQLQDAARALFADPACGHILRIKGFLQTVDGWCELNATRDTMHVEAIPDGQEVLIIIGEELDRLAIEAHIGQKTADQE